MEFPKLIDIIETKRNTILHNVHNVKIKWILMLNLAKKVVEKYKIFLVKMAMDNLINHQAKLNYEHLCDL